MQQRKATQAQTNENKRYRENFRNKVRSYQRIYGKNHPTGRTPEQKRAFNVWQRKRSLKLIPLQRRSWWCLLSEEHQTIFLTEFDPDKHTINKFRAYLSQLPKNGNKGNTLTASQVTEIKKALREGLPNIPGDRVGGYLAKKYGVSRQTINHIKQGKTWKYVL
ncbi:MAG: hypothetical protein ACKPCP_14795 [Sphaerospermopsis kisseleviana]